MLLIKVSSFLIFSCGIAFNVPAVYEGFLALYENCAAILRQKTLLE
jgi:hypothetical protein